jgi:hypothetical protein
MRASVFPAVSLPFSLPMAVKSKPRATTTSRGRLDAGRPMMAAANPPVNPSFPARDTPCSIFVTLAKMAVVANRDDGETPGSHMPLISFNPYHRTGFAGLPTLLHAHCPHLMFVQWVSPHASICAVVAAAGYLDFLSTSTAPLKGPRLCWAVFLFKCLSSHWGTVSWFGWAMWRCCLGHTALLHGLHPILQWPMGPLLGGDFLLVLSSNKTWRTWPVYKFS